MRAPYKAVFEVCKLSELVNEYDRSAEIILNKKKDSATCDSGGTGGVGECSVSIRTEEVLFQNDEEEE